MLYEIYEIEYSVSPGGVNTFEVYAPIDDVPVYSSVNLQDVVQYCYVKGVDFRVHTLEQYYQSEYQLEFNLGV